jgi:hypothetical protein
MFACGNRKPNNMATHNWYYALYLITFTKKAYKLYFIGVNSRSSLHCNRIAGFSDRTKVFRPFPFPSQILLHWVKAVGSWDRPYIQLHIKFSIHLQGKILKPMASFTLSTPSLRTYMCLYACLSYPFWKSRIFSPRFVLSSAACLVYHISLHYLIKGRIFGENVLNIKCVFGFPLQILSETFLILRRIQRDIIINVHRPLCKVPLLLSDFNETWISLTEFGKLLQY